MVEPVLRRIDPLGPLFALLGLGVFLIHGYGGVLTGWHASVEDELRAVLSIPADATIAATIPLGRPVGHHGPVRRRPLGEVVFDGRWDAPAAWAVDPPGTEFAGRPPR